MITHALATTDVLVQKKCKHCGASVPLARLHLSTFSERDFCCDGCSSVFELLTNLNLRKQYEELRGEKRSEFKPVSQTGEDFSVLDEPPFRMKTENTVLSFYLEGIHCSACVWILEKLNDMSNTIEWSRIDLGNSLIKVKIKPEGSFEAVAQLLLKLGYRPHALLSEKDADRKRNTDDKQTLRRIGVAAFSAMNVMIYSISLYSGVSGKLAVLFRALSLVTAIPALTFSAWPFYRSSYLALKNKRISIDLPISLAFIGGFAESIRQIYLGTNLLYLDSITSLVFLMLLSRYVLSRLERSETSKSGLLNALLPARILKIVNGERIFVRMQDLNANDLIYLDQEARIPVDGIVESGDGWADHSILTGESKFVALKPGSHVFAGCRFVEGLVCVRVQSLGTKTKLGAIQEQIDALSPASNRRTERSDRWAQMFLWIVLGVALVLLIAFGQENAQEAIKRSLALIIIACPCALALATPLTLTKAYQWAVHQGILLRNTSSLDKILEVTDVVFDKTGTLTLGKPVVKEWVWCAPYPEHARALFYSAAYTLENTSNHPYGKAIARYLENRLGVCLFEGTKVTETPGFGVEATIQGDIYRVFRLNHEIDEGSWVELSKNGNPIARILLEDELRPEAISVVNRLKKQGYRLHLLSGDSDSTVSLIARIVGIKNYKSRLSPEEKRDELKKIGQNALAIGDGINDALLLKEASVGVAFSRGEGASIENALLTSDVALTRSHLKSLLNVFEVAQKYNRTLNRNAVISVIYNLIGASFAVSGYIHPLIAAIAMPVSAVTVFISTIWGLRRGSTS